MINNFHRLSLIHERLCNYFVNMGLYLSLKQENKLNQPCEIVVPTHRECNSTAKINYKSSSLQNGHGERTAGLVFGRAIEFQGKAVSSVKFL